MLRIIPHPKPPGQHPDPIDFGAIRRIAYKALNVPEEGEKSFPAQYPNVILTTSPTEAPTTLSLPVHNDIDQSRRVIRDALVASRAGKAPSIDVDRCLLFSPPTKFLSSMWSELVTASTMGDIETPRRIATFILSTPRSPRSPPLLPVFLHVILPSVMTSLDNTAPPEQTMVTELIVATISSALTLALHIEWALLSVCNEQRYVLGHSTAGMARRLGGDLRRGNSSTTKIIFQRLSSSQSFMTNFPTFIAEL